MPTIFHTNDLHGSLNAAMAARLAMWKAEAGLDAAYFDSGDCIKAGNLAIPLRPEAAWMHLKEAGCDAGTLGNRESHPLEAGFAAKLKGATHPLVVANLRRKRGGPLLPGSIVIERGGVSFGILGVMVPMVTARMAAAAASAYLWDPPIPTAAELARKLRPEVDLLVALTHIGHRADLELAETAPEIDLILGGHSHTVVDPPVRVGQTFVCQGGSHGRCVGVYAWSERGRLDSAELRPLSP